MAAFYLVTVIVCFFIGHWSALALNPNLLSRGARLVSVVARSVSLELDFLQSETPIANFCSAAEIQDLNIRNLYESQVLATLGGAAGGLRVVKYPYIAPKDEAETLTPQFYKDVFLSSFPVEPKFFEGIRTKLMKKNYEIGNNFECDLYIKLPGHDSTLNVERLLQFSTTTLFPLNAFDPAQVIIPGKWALIEISESAAHLAQKLFQLERALHLLPRATTDFSIEDVGAVIVLLNGRREDAEKAVNLVKLNHNLLMSKFPVFVGWVPYRNLFSTINTLQQEVKEMGTELHRMDTDINQMGTDIKQLVTSVDKLTSALGKDNSKKEKAKELLMTPPFASFLESAEKRGIIRVLFSDNRVCEEFLLLFNDEDRVDFLNGLLKCRVPIN